MKNKKKVFEKVRILRN